jgi:hypothetical protein
MLRTGITNHPDFPIDEWTRQNIDLGELFEIPTDLSKTEIELARGFMETLNIETDDDETLLEIISKPSGLMSLFINVKRIVEQQYQNNLCSDR